MHKIIKAALLAATFSPATALAQTNLDVDATAGETIVVTGTGSTDPVPADRVGGSITVLDADSPDRRQTREVSDILRDVPRVAVGRVFAVVGHHFFNRPGPRLVESAEIIAGIIGTAESSHVVQGREWVSI